MTQRRQLSLLPKPPICTNAMMAESIHFVSWVKHSLRFTMLKRGPRFGGNPPPVPSADTSPSTCTSYTRRERRGSSCRSGRFKGGIRRCRTEDVKPEQVTDDAPEGDRQSVVSDAETDIPSVGEEDEEEEESHLPHSTFRGELVKPRAIRSLEQAIQFGIEACKYDIVSKAAMHLAHAHGSADTGKAAAALALVQSCQAVETHLSIFISAADEQDIESLIIKNDRIIQGALNEMTSSKYSAFTFLALEDLLHSMGETAD